MEQKILILALIAIILVVLSGMPLRTETKIISNLTKTQEIFKPENLSYTEAEIKIPAVDNQGRGVATTLKVQAKIGEGRTLINIDQLLFWIDTQNSIRIAKAVAQNITKLDLSKIDLIYTIEANASIIEGPSAGAAITIATIAALQNKSVNQSVMITGTINPDGSIGQVGGILAKAKASKDIGATLFLVPKGQGTQVNYVPQEKCERIGPLTYCTITYKEESIDISEKIGIKVLEVSSIYDALKYFLI
jgi:uncharacterized protein